MSEISEGAARYRDFRDLVFGEGSEVSRVAESARGGRSDFLPELEIQARWYAGEYGRRFESTDGEAIEVVQFGHWNHGAGPDFTECAVRVGDELRAGSIEVDLEAGYWEVHGHGANAAFDDVVLHVFLTEEESRFYTRNSQHRSVAQVALGREVGAGDTRAVWGTLPEAKRGRCAMPLAALSEERLLSLLKSAAQYRMEEKSKRHFRMGEVHGEDQAIYQGVAEALGYRHNKIPMAVLSQRLPIRGLSRREVVDREALIFGASGFLDLEHFQTGGDETKTYLKGLWDAWWKLRSEAEPEECRRLSWKTASTRPTNHPQRRLGAMAALVNDWHSFRKTVPLTDEEPAKNWMKDCRTFLGNLSHEYWEQHYTLKSKATENALALIGRDRVHDVLGNILFPAVLRNHPTEWDRYESLPGSLLNEKLRRAAIRLFGDKDGPRAKLALKTFAWQQALLQIYTDFCLEDVSECEDCPFPEQLKQWV